MSSFIPYHFHHGTFWFNLIAKLGVMTGRKISDILSLNYHYSSVCICFIWFFRQHLLLYQKLWQLFNCHVLHNEIFFKLFQGIDKTSKKFGTVSSLILSGSCICPKTSFVRDNSDNFFYWGRRGPSVHLQFSTPKKV